MPWAGDVDHVQVVLFDEPVQVDVDEVEARRGSPVAEEPRLDVVFRERLLQQRVVVEIDLADRKVVGGAPVRVYQGRFLVRKRIRHDCLLSGAVGGRSNDGRAYQSSCHSRRWAGLPVRADLASMSSVYLPT